MKHTMNDAVECVKESKSKLDKSKKNLIQVVRKGTLFRELFMETVNVEVGVVWKNGKHKNDKKLKFSIQKRKETETRTKETKATFKGVIVGDKELDLLESKQMDENINKARVYSNIEVDENQKSILLLPPNLQTTKHFPN